MCSFKHFSKYNEYTQLVGVGLKLTRQFRIVPITHACYNFIKPVSQKNWKLQFVTVQFRSTDQPN